MKPSNNSYTPTHICKNCGKIAICNEYTLKSTDSGIDNRSRFYSANIYYSGTDKDWRCGECGVPKEQQRIVTLQPNQLELGRILYGKS